MDASPDPDLMLIQEFVSGRVDAFDRLYERHAGYVYNTCLGILGRPDDARDAMQETFIQLYRSLASFRAQSKLSTWLYRVAVNKCMDVLRAHPRWESTENLEWVKTADGNETNSIHEAHVRQTILKLKPQYRTVLVLCYFQQLSYTEIAEALGCSVNQVRIRLHRARKAFRRLYEEVESNNEM